MGGIGGVWPIRGKAVVRAGCASMVQHPGLSYPMNRLALQPVPCAPDVVTIRRIRLITNVHFRLMKRASDKRVIIRTKAKYFANPT